ncbi:glycosyltransferase [Vibrio breoganii]
MKGMFVSLGILGHDGRQKELLDILRDFSEIDIVAPRLVSDSNVAIDSDLTIKNRNNRSGIGFYLRFIFKAISKKVSCDYDYIFIDDYQSSIVGLLLKAINRRCVIITDSREFYFGRKMPGLGKWLVIAEKYLIRKSDIVIAANDYRADLMRILYKIQRPLVFENLRTLSCDISQTSVSDKYRLVSTGGCFIERGTLELIKSVKNHKDVSLLIVGKGNESDYKKIKREIEYNDITNVKIIDRVPFSELCSILSESDGGIIEYHLNDLNNYFCASGKVYEYLSLGMPVIVTPNPPLMKFINEHGCGVIAKNFDWDYGINMFKEKYNVIKNTAVEMSSSIDSEKHRSEFRIELLNKIKSLSDDDAK